jgi:hypothetical protein
MALACRSPLLGYSDATIDPLEQWADEARQLSATLRRLEVVVGDGDQVPSRRAVTAATTEVDEVLQKCHATVEAWQSALDAAGDALARTEAAILVWLKAATIAVTFLCVRVAAGQVILFAHALRSCRGA